MGPCDFRFQHALASGYYSGNAPYDAPDDGTAILTALTKCDEYSWCSGLLKDNLTMTREAWHAGASSCRLTFVTIARITPSAWREVHTDTFSPWIIFRFVSQVRTRTSGARARSLGWSGV
jgi:hypothetical protein